MLAFYRLQKWGWGQLFAAMDGDGDDLETSCEWKSTLRLHHTFCTSPMDTKTLPKTSQWCNLWKPCAHCNLRLDFRGWIILKFNRVRNLKLWAALLTFWPLVINCWK